jgi:hypothetical protein
VVASVECYRWGWAVSDGSDAAAASLIVQDLSRICRWWNVSPFSSPPLVMQRPPELFDHLTEPLTIGEAQVVSALAMLEPGWTTYVKPRVGLDRLDFLVLHDRFGVCTISVVDWTPNTTRRTADGRFEVWAADGTWVPTNGDPRYRSNRCRSSIFDQFYALPEHGGTPTASIRSVVILPEYPTVAGRDLFANSGDDERNALVEIWGGDALESLINDIVRGPGCPPPPVDSIEKLRRHIVASEVTSNPTGWSDRLSPAVIDIAENPLGLRHRRVRGAAGAGKSTALTARAAQLAADGKDVLVLTFNVTLANRLRSMVDDHCGDIGANPTRVSCANFHSFCTRVVQDAEFAGARMEATPGLPWTFGIVAKAEQAYEHGLGPRYDAVLVDEGQDYMPAWWKLLSERVLRNGGETLIVADPTQDIYDRFDWLNDTESVPGSALGPDWIVLDTSLRMPPDALALANDFAAHYLEGEQLLGTGAEPSKLRSVRHWNGVERLNDLGNAIGREVVRLLKSNPTLAPGDISFVCDYHHDGVAAVRAIEAAGYPVHHVFSRDPDAPRRWRKHRFWPDASAVKGCTLHSLKGLESSAIVFGIGADARARRLAYVALTRAVAPGNGNPAFISVVSADASLADFGTRFIANPATLPDPSVTSPAPSPPSLAPLPSLVVPPPPPPSLAPPRPPSLAPPRPPSPQSLASPPVPSIV